MDGPWSEEGQMCYEGLDTIDGDERFMPLELLSGRPIKTLDFGTNGYTASLSVPHDLLQLTYPHPKYGLCYIRGAFTDDADSILAQMKRHDHGAGFGLRLYISGTTLVATPAQGFINLRWPCAIYNFVRRTDLGPVNVASQTICSFSAQDTIYQIARILPTDLTTEDSPSKASSSSESGHELVVDLGGQVRFGSFACPLSGQHQVQPKFGEPDEFDHVWVDESAPYVAVYESYTYATQLELRLWVNDAPMRLKIQDHKPASTGPTASASELNKHLRHVYIQLRRDFESQPTTVVASWRIADISGEAPDRSIPRPSNERIKAALGMSHPWESRWSNDGNPTLMAWEHALRSFASYPIAPRLGALAINSIVRTVESIMGVLSISLPDPMSTKDKSSFERFPLIGPLLKNTMMPPVVDLESMFWQVRFLVKLHLLFDQQRWKASSYPEYGEYEAIKTFQKSIETKLHEVCWWVLGAVARIDATSTASRHHQPPEKEITEGRRISCPTAPSGNQRFYPAIIAWYIFNNVPGIVGDRDPEQNYEKLWHWIEALNEVQEADNSTNSIDNENPHGCILRWYHCASVLEICKFLYGKDKERFLSLTLTPSRRSELSRRLQHIWPRNREASQTSYWRYKATKALRLYSQGRFQDRPLGHRAANLIMVGTELGFGDDPGYQACVPLVQDLVRRQTREFNGDISRSRPYSALPESICLDRHRFTNLGVWQDASELEQFLEGCSNFLMSDITFASSLSSKETPADNWDLTTSNIICADLVEYLTRTAKVDENREGDGMSG
ncbi:hypothetical protein QBC47DRAFT_461906 [Echria macrotheca]|uniref:Uncharacterized protein n=1 Tax=Echria macrotheca TaxID=438768 RepID=A0AAJ0BBB6_9PEZI|nr:hypothetical protein QBC47DRAFT_461906 [Echria macrotheca]